MAAIQGALGPGVRRRAHAYIFHGPRGVGKELTAQQFAQLMLCEQPVESVSKVRAVRDACDRCDSCRLMKAGNHPDYHLVCREQIRFIDPNRKGVDLSIDLIREEVIRRAGLMSSSGRGKVFVIREAHLMTREAQNSLLKTLEEPPPGTFLILLAPRPNLLLPTTRSRSWPIRFRPLATAFVRERLEAEGTPPAEADFWARSSRGSLGGAMQLARWELYPFKCELIERLACLKASEVVPLAKDSMDQGKAIGKLMVRDMPMLTESRTNMSGYQVVFGLLADGLRDAMWVGAGGARDQLIHSDQEKTVEQLAGRLPARAAALGVKRVSEAGNLMNRNVNANLVWDNLVSDLCGLMGG